MPARILIVEDEALVAMELRFVLEDLGHEVAGQAADTATALTVVGDRPIDLALVDIHLSDGPTGVGLGRRLAAQGVTVVFLTANPGMVRDGVDGALGVLSKPTDERAVGSTVAYALAHREGEPVQYAPPELKLFAA